MRGGSFKLFQVAGITVYLHFTWFLVAWFEINSGARRYEQPIWAAAEYVTLFAIVLLHEFGHAFACRSTGGRADRIVLWPLGGLAFVDPPLRPTAVLWSIAAGPLVNVVLYPVLEFLVIATGLHGWIPIGSDAHRFFFYIWWINRGLLFFNLLPFFPLDGGQIVRALLWFKVGPIRSLQYAGVIGIVGAACLGMYAFYSSSIWIGILAFFLFSQASAALSRAKEMALANNVPPATPSVNPGDRPPPTL